MQHAKLACRVIIEIWETQCPYCLLHWLIRVNPAHLPAGDARGWHRDMEIRCEACGKPYVARLRRTGPHDPAPRS